MRAYDELGKALQGLPLDIAIALLMLRVNELIGMSSIPTEWWEFIIQQAARRLEDASSDGGTMH
jgi:hypothetical protein